MIAGITIDNPYEPQLVVSRIKEIGRRIAIRTIWDPPSTSPDFDAIKDFVLAVEPYSDSYIAVADSFGIKELSVGEYAARAERICAELGPKVVVEILNEGGGDWLGDDVVEKAKAAEAVCRRHGNEIMATYYLSGDNIPGMAKWAASAGLSPDIAAISWYPYWTPKVQLRAAEWEKILSDLLMAHQNKPRLAIGETGPEPKYLGTVGWTNFIQSAYSLRPSLPEYIGGVFLWDAFKLLRANGPQWSALIHSLRSVP